jgi:hypothetical protein
LVCWYQNNKSLAVVQWIGQHSSKVRIGVRFPTAGPIMFEDIDPVSLIILAILIVALFCSIVKND